MNTVIAMPNTARTTSAITPTFQARLGFRAPATRSVPELAARDQSRIGVALQPFQVGAHLGSALVAQVAIFLQQFQDDLFELHRHVGIQPHRRTGGRFRMASKITGEVSPRKGSVPVAIS